MKNNILITGGAGFIGSHLVKLFTKKYSDYNIYNVDILSYASNLDFISDLNNHKNYNFISLDIRDFKEVNKIFKTYNITHVINLAAESHVDNSINNPILFLETNVLGTVNLLEAARTHWKNCFENKLFYQISTDEVFGSLKNEGKFTESSPYKPNSPYSASKASADHFVRSYGKTYNLPYIISNSSNNFGPNQNKEKLIPTVIKSIIENKMIPVYGNGKNIRDWIYVEDHVKLIEIIFHRGTKYENYNIGSNNEWTNIDLINLIIEIMLKKKMITKSSSSLIKYIEDRPGHDYRYSVDIKKIINQFKWKSSKDFISNMQHTIDWYLKEFNSV